MTPATTQRGVYQTRSRPMSLDRITSLPPATVHTATPQPAATPAAKAGAASVHQQSVHQNSESQRGAAAMKAALATGSKPLGAREVVLHSGKNAHSQPLSPHQQQQLLQGMGNYTGAQVKSLLTKTRQQLREQKSIKKMVEDDGALLTHLLLSEVARQDNEKGKGKGNEAELAQAHLEALDAEHGEEIRTGLVITPALARTVKDCELRDNLRTVFYHHLVKNPSLANLTEAVLHLCGEEHFLKGLHALQQALADDIANLSQLPQQRKLLSLMEVLGRSSQLNNLVHNCAEMVSRMASKNPALTFTSLQFLRELMQLANQSMNVSGTRALMEKMSGPAPAVRHAFLNSLHLLLDKSVPRALWPDFPEDKIRGNSLRNVKLIMRELGEAERSALPDRSSKL
jgi:type III secretion protein W